MAGAVSIGFWNLGIEGLRIKVSRIKDFGFLSALGGLEFGIISFESCLYLQTNYNIPILTAHE